MTKRMQQAQFLNAKFLEVVRTNPEAAKSTVHEYLTRRLNPEPWRKIRSSPVLGTVTIEDVQVSEVAGQDNSPCLRVVIRLIKLVDSSNNKTIDYIWECPISEILDSGNPVTHLLEAELHKAVSMA